MFVYQILRYAQDDEMLRMTGNVQENGKHPERLTFSDLG